MTKPIRFFAAFKAVIRHNGNILMLRESAAYEDGISTGFYDFPGGRLTPGESWGDALRREVMEECGLHVTIGQPFYTHESRQDRGPEDWQIVRTFYDCTTDNDYITLGPDYDHFIWCKPDELLNQKFIPNLEQCIRDYLRIIQPQVAA